MLKIIVQCFHGNFKSDKEKIISYKSAIAAKRKYSRKLSGRCNMRNYKVEFENRVAFIKELLAKSGAEGIVYGNSGGKDCTLAAILCKAACDNTVGIVMPCTSKRNYELDMDDAKKLANAYGIETRVADLTPVKEALVKSALGATKVITKSSDVNIAPRLRMTVLYTIAASENRLVVGTGNRSEMFVGYFTKWGDGGCDFNPISDLTVTEVYEFLSYLKAPEFILTKAPSAGLFDGQTDEDDMGVSYGEIDAYINGEQIDAEKAEIVARMHSRSAHKRAPIARFKENADG